MDETKAPKIIINKKNITTTVVSIWESIWECIYIYNPGYIIYIICIRVGGWTNPFEKICSWNWIISPGIGMNILYVTCLLLGENDISNLPPRIFGSPSTTKTPWLLVASGWGHARPLKSYLNGPNRKVDKVVFQLHHFFRGENVC